jgi:hypothetical protein
MTVVAVEVVDDVAALFGEDPQAATPKRAVIPIAATAKCTPTRCVLNGPPISKRLRKQSMRGSIRPR